MGTGGAPTSKVVLDWMAATFECSAYDSYGITETGSIAMDNTLQKGVKVPPS